MSSTNFVVWGSDDNQSYGPTQRAREIGTQGVQAADPQVPFFGGSTWDRYAINSPENPKYKVCFFYRE